MSEDLRTATRNLTVAAVAGALAAAMLGAVLRRRAALFRLLPRHRLCRHDAGRANTAAGMRGARTIKVRFDANVAPGLDWSFEPETRASTCAPARRRPYFSASATSPTARPSARAVYNVTPEISGAWFDKISCFCFTEQQLGPRRERGIAGGVLSRSAARAGPRHGWGRRDHAVLHAVRAPGDGQAGGAGAAIGCGRRPNFDPTRA